jgi:glycine hydroxymethyltransferase
VTSGIRIGTPSVTTRGMKEPDMKTIAKLINDAITHRKDESALKKVCSGVDKLTRDFPIYENLEI